MSIFEICTDIFNHGKVNFDLEKGLEYALKRQEANAQNRRLTLEDLKIVGIEVYLG